MNKKIARLLTLSFCIAAFSPAYAQDNPSKFEMKKDADNDGVKNKRDKCASTPPGILVDGTGCPLDTDKDGVSDYLDKCPAVPGSADMNGCQDKDKDGVSDIDDICADVPGLARFKGCPDSDNDGIEDAKDICPNAKGSDMFHGCPDTDEDGITDADDKCPNTAKGVKVDAGGCASDADGDGVLDADDKCAGTQMGIKVNATGCPADTDKDGVLDADDKCPGIIGEVSNNGCPVVKKEAARRLKFTPRKVNFDSKNAVIKVSSYPMLDEVASILSGYPDYNLRLGGHTDGLEKEAAALSQSRVDAVKSYLLTKGVEDSRIVAAVHGKTIPVSTNANAAGRSQNRRVTVELYLR